ncbi:MAG: LysM peptidoglycan-binding domain-containing protein [Bryobacteraceae bacterium]|nr:LysM peptidoglycan-binding domain-containing protein [Bryobacteraceae bacterium]
MADDKQQRTQQLKEKYGSALRVIEQQGVRLENVHVENNKLLIRGVAPSEDAKNKVWDQIKLVDPSYSDLICDLRVEQRAGQAAAAGQTQAAAQTYTVQAGDSLSKISKQFYGDANAYMRIFEANRDKLSDPDKIKPGQQLTIPK